MSQCEADYLIEASVAEMLMEKDRPGICTASPYLEGTTTPHFIAGLYATLPPVLLFPGHSP